MLPGSSAGKQYAGRQARVQEGCQNHGTCKMAATKDSAGPMYVLSICAAACTIGTRRHQHQKTHRLIEAPLKELLLHFSTLLPAVCKHEQGNQNETG